MDISVPINDSQIESLKVGDKLSISGIIYAGRDAVLPKILRLIEEEKLSDKGIVLQGAVIFHTAVSDAGVGPTTSSKVEIEESILPLSRAGVKIHLGKGALSRETVESLNQHNSIFTVTPPVTALFSDSIISKKVLAFPELGMEAFWELSVKGMPGIVAIAHGDSIF